MTAKLACAAMSAGITPAAQQLADRRRRASGDRWAGGGRAGLALLVASSSAIRFGSGRTVRTIASADDHEPARGHPQRAERVAVEVAAGEQRAEHGRTEDRAEDRAEEHERDAAGAALGRVHVARRRPRQQRRRARRARRARARRAPRPPTSCAVPSAASRQPAMPQPKPRGEDRAPGPCGPSSRPGGQRRQRARRRARSRDRGRAAPRCRARCTSVSDATAADSCSVAEFIACELDSSAVLRAIGELAHPRRD